MLLPSLSTSATYSFYGTWVGLIVGRLGASNAGYKASLLVNSRTHTIRFFAQSSDVVVYLRFFAFIFILFHHVVASD